MEVATQIFIADEKRTVVHDGLQLSWGLRGAWLLQKGHECDFAHDSCGTENIHVLVLLIMLCLTLITVFCTFTFLREEKDEDITPLSPQLLVKEEDLFFTMPLDKCIDSMIIRNTANGLLICNVDIDWPGPSRDSTSVSANAKITGANDHVIATMVARNTQNAAQSFALCRHGCEIFGFVEPDGPRQYIVRHRTGVHLLTLSGDFGPTTGSINIEGINAMGSHVCWLTKTPNSTCVGRVLQNVDAGLVVASLLATYVHRRLVSGAGLPAQVEDSISFKDSSVDDTSEDEPFIG